MNLLGAALTAKPGSICMSMVKDIPFSANLNDTSMVVSAVGSCILGFLVAVNSAVTVRNNYSAILVRSKRILGSCIAKLMTNLGRVDEVVGIIMLSDRRSLKECMIFKLSPLAIAVSWCSSSAT